MITLEMSQWLDQKVELLKAYHGKLTDNNFTPAQATEIVSRCDLNRGNIHD